MASKNRGTRDANVGRSNYCCTRVLLCAKMLKETETEKTRLFCLTFLIGGISSGGKASPLSPPSNPLATTMHAFDYDITFMKEK